MSTFELDTIVMLSSCINRVLEEYQDDPRVRSIHGRSCVYRAALTKSFLTRQGISNTLWTGNVRWAADTYPAGRDQPPKTRYLDCFEQDARQGDLGGHVCNLVQLNDGTCWLLDIAVDQFIRDAEHRDGLDLPAIEPPQILLALTPNKRLDDITQTGWRLSKKIANTNTWYEYRYDKLFGFRRLRKLDKQGHQTGLNPKRWPDIYEDIVTLFDFRLQSLSTTPSFIMKATVPKAKSPSQDPE